MSRSLWPREHGAYAQLGAPLVGALAMRAPTAPAIGIALGAALAFLAHEPLLVVLGHRGKRMREQAGARARRWLAVLGGLALVTGGAGLALAPAAAHTAALLLAAPVALMLVLAWRHQEHTFWGELVGAVTLTGAAAPVACASGVTLAAASTIWAAWAIGYGASVVAVHRVLARHKKPATWIDAVVGGALLAADVALVAAATAESILVIAMPLAAVATVVGCAPPPATRLRTVGVILSVAAAMSTALHVLVA